MIVRKLRLRRAWSQETLAELSGLSVRTIQRIERGQSAGLESLQALASALEVEVTTLQPQPQEEERDMGNPPTITNEAAEPRLSLEEEDAIRYVRDIKAFYSHAVWYAVTVSVLLICNLLDLMAYRATGWTAFGWGIGVALHGLVAFEKVSVFGPAWERKRIEKRLGRKL